MQLSWILLSIRACKHLSIEITDQALCGPPHEAHGLNLEAVHAESSWLTEGLAFHICVVFLQRHVYSISCSHGETASYWHLLNWRPVTQFCKTGSVHRAVIMKAAQKQDSLQSQWRYAEFLWVRTCGLSSNEILEKETQLGKPPIKDRNDIWVILKRQVHTHPLCSAIWWRAIGHWWRGFLFLTSWSTVLLISRAH